MKEITHIGKNGFPIPITPPMPEAVLAEDFDYSMYIQNLIDTAPYIDIEKLLYSKEETSTLPFEYLFDKYLNDIITIQTIYEDDLKENVTSIDYNKAMKDIARNYLDSLKKQINYKIDRKKKIKSLMTKRKYLISKLKLPLRKDNKTASFNRIDAFINREIPLGKLLDLILIGGWPANVGLNEEEGRLVAKEYINSVLKSDIFKVDNIKRDSHKLELLLWSLARNESTTVTNSKLLKDIKDIDSKDINIDSITSYLNLINDLYLAENIPPFSNKIRSSLRVKQSEKRHFVDPSLVCALLNVTKEKLLSDFEFLGFVFESLVIRDLLTYVDGFNAKLYHYQDYNNDKMDAVIELEDGEWCGVEIKLGAHQIDKAAQNLVKINKKIINKGGKGARSLIVICGLSNAAYLREDGVYVVPITSLKD